MEAQVNRTSLQVIQYRTRTAHRIKIPVFIPTVVLVRSAKAPLRSKLNTVVSHIGPSTIHQAEERIDSCLDFRQSNRIELKKREERSITRRVNHRRALSSNAYRRERRIIDSWRCVAPAQATVSPISPKVEPADHSSTWPM